MQSLVRLCHHDGEIAWFRYECLGMKCLFQGYSNKLLSSGTESRADNSAIANLRSYSQSCTAASCDDSVKCLSQEPKCHSSSGS